MQNIDTIWTEKYRPTTFSEIKGQKDVVKRVKAFVEQKNMPHLLFAGPAGTGKTTLAIVIAKSLFGKNWHDYFLDLNASDERGIDVIRNKVKDFARTKALGDVPFKIIYLDECLDYNSTIVVNSEGGLKRVKIGDFVENYDPNKYQVMSIDDNGDIIFSQILNSIKIPHDFSKGFYKVVIHDKEILLTGNHELLTINGWKKVDELKIKDLVLCPQETPQIRDFLFSHDVVYNLIGLPQEIKKKEKYIAQSPEKKIIELLGKFSKGLTREEITSKIASSKITSILSSNDNNYYLPLLKHKILTKNKSNQEYIVTQLRNEKLFSLKTEKAIICARILGHLFSDGCLSLKTKQLFFSGKEEDLKEIKKDLNKLGYYSLGSIRHTTWKNGECWSFRAYKIDLLSLFYSLGAPIGKKTDNIVKIPDWIINGDKIIKSEFLASFFGGDGHEPKFQGRTIKPILVRISKREDLKDNLLIYLKQIKRLLEDFGISAKYRICSGYKWIRKDGPKSIEGRIWITNSSDNIYKFLTNIGYRYCSYKEKIAKETIRYLEWKKSLGKKIYTLRPVPNFYEWRKDFMLGDSSYYYITSIEKIKDPKFVYCLTTDSGRFVANDIVVHNCDALTKEAQQALRRTMENFTRTCRFILACNYSSKIIEPIQSRCAIFRFKPLNLDDVESIVEKIAKEEKFYIDKKALETLYEVSGGDCRQIENILQSTAATEKHINEDAIYSMISIAKPKEIKEILELALKHDFNKAREKLLDTMLNYGLSGLDIIKQFQKEIWNLAIEDEQKAFLADKCGEFEFRMTEGSDEYLQLEAFLAQFFLLRK